MDDANRSDHGHFSLDEVEDLDPAIGAANDDEHLRLAIILFDDNPVTTQKGLRVRDRIQSHFRCTIIDVLLKRVDLLLFIDAISTLFNPREEVHKARIRTHNGEVDDVVQRDVAYR